MIHHNLNSARQRKSFFVALTWTGFLAFLSAASTGAASEPEIHDKSLSPPIATGVAGESSSPEANSVIKRARPKPDQSYAGASIAANGIARAAASEEKKYSMRKRIETTRAGHAKRAVEHGDSPELQARNEKLRKIKEQFKIDLEKREERKSRRIDSADVSK